MEARRTIRVTGRGALKLHPDLTRLSLTLQGSDMDYGTVLQRSAEETEALRDVLASLGFAREALKTLQFNVDTLYEGYQDEKGIYRQKFAGYDCFHALRVEFDMDSARLSAVVCALAGSSAAPEFHIRFTVKDTEAVLDRVLKDAATQAKKKAEVLCAASGVKLGALVSIDYGAFAGELYSRTECAPMLRMAKAGNGMADMDIVPEDVRTEETVTFTWEIG
jgi:uncharacterized protein YggE